MSGVSRVILPSNEADEADLKMGTVPDSQLEAAQQQKAKSRSPFRRRRRTRCEESCSKKDCLLAEKNIESCRCSMNGSEKGRPVEIDLNLNIEQAIKK
jgi:hypothetical protein